MNNFKVDDVPYLCVKLLVHHKLHKRCLSSVKFVSSNNNNGCLGDDFVCIFKWMKYKL